MFDLGAAGAIGSGIAGLFGKNAENPADKAMPYLNQIPGATGQYYQPYIAQGRQIDPGLQAMYGSLMSNPGDFYNQLGQGYQKSPGYDFSLQQALAAGNNAFAAGGMTGSPAHQFSQMSTASGLASKDYENYINHVLGLFGQGLGGEQGLSNRAYGASTGYGDILGSNLAQQANMAYQGQNAENQANQTNWGNIFGGFAKMFPENDFGGV
jgi:hypothetical protein